MYEDASSAECYDQPDFPRSISTAVQRLLDQAGLRRLACDTQGCSDFCVALLDGSVETTHPLLRGATIRQGGGASSLQEPASRHATLLASALVGARGPTLGLCSRCTLLSIPVIDRQFAAGQLTPFEAGARVAAGIREAVRRGAHVLQLSLAFDPEQGRACGEVVSALASAAARGIIAVVAAGNVDHLASNPIMHAPGAVGVVAADARGAPMALGVLGPNIGRRGLLAPGYSIPGAIPPSSTGWSSGSSIAACFVTGTFALLRCCFPMHTASEVLTALVRPKGTGSARSVVPPHIDGDASAAQLRRSNRSHGRIQHDNTYRR